MWATLHLGQRSSFLQWVAVSGVMHDFQSTDKKRLSTQPQQAIPIIPQLAPTQASGKIVEGKAERILDPGEGKRAA